MRRRRTLPVLVTFILRAIDFLVFCLGMLTTVTGVGGEETDPKFYP